MKKIILSFILVVTTSYAYLVAIANENPIVGNWRIVETSIPSNIFPEACLATTYKFTNDGFLVIDDRKLKLKKSFTVKPEGNGYVIVVKTISVSGSESCQGSPATVFKIGEEGQLYAEVLKGGKSLKLNWAPKGGSKAGYALIERIADK